MRPRRLLKLVLKCAHAAPHTCPCESLLPSTLHTHGTIVRMHCRCCAKLSSHCCPPNKLLLPSYLRVHQCAPCAALCCAQLVGWQGCCAVLSYCITGAALCCAQLGGWRGEHQVPGGQAQQMQGRWMPSTYRQVQGCWMPSTYRQRARMLDIKTLAWHLLSEA